MPGSPIESDRRQRWGCVGSLQLETRDHAWVFIFKQPYGKSLTICFNRVAFWGRKRLKHTDKAIDHVRSIQGVQLFSGTVSPACSILGSWLLAWGIPCRNTKVFILLATLLSTASPTFYAILHLRRRISVANHASYLKGQSIL